MADHKSSSSATALFTMVDLALVLLDAEGRVVRGNPALCQLLGAAEQDIVGRRLTDFVHPDDADLSFRTGDTSQLPEPADIRLQNGGGEIAEVTVNVSPAPADLPGVALVQVRPRPRESDATSASLVREVVSHLPVVLFAYDRDGICTLSEGELLVTLGLSPGQIVGLSLYDVYSAHADICDSLRRTLDGASFATTAQVAGTAFETYFRPLRDGAGDIAGGVGVAIDVTQRVEAEEALRRSESISASLLNAMPCTLYRVEGEDLMVTVKAEPGSMAGGEAAVAGPVVSRPLTELFSQETAEELDHCLRRALQTSQAQGLEFEVADPDGRRYFDAQVVPSSPDEAMLVVRDVTELRQLEVELRQAQKLEAIGRLAAGLAHEINTPVQFVGDNINFLRDAFSDLLSQATQRAAGVDPAGAAFADLEFLRAEVPQAMDQTQEGITRVSAIVRALKSFAHPSGTNQAPADLNKALQDTIIVAGSEYRMVADLRTNLGALPPVRCHLGDINQVFLNLLVNAGHAVADTVGDSAERGLITVSSSTQGHAVLIEIADTGGGIPVDIRHRVFDPFFTTKEVGRGTGQGLALARSIVQDRHGGSLTFVCPPTGGTVFSVLIPVAGVTGDPERQGELRDPIGAVA